MLDDCKITKFNNSINKLYKDKKKNNIEYENIINKERKENLNKEHKINLIILFVNLLFNFIILGNLFFIDFEFKDESRFSLSFILLLSFSFLNIVFFKYFLISENKTMKTAFIYFPWEFFLFSFFGSYSFTLLLNIFIPSAFENQEISLFYIIPIIWFAFLFFFTLTNHINLKKKQKESITEKEFQIKKEEYKILEKQNKHKEKKLIHSFFNEIKTFKEFDYLLTISSEFSTETRNHISEQADFYAKQNGFKSFKSLKKTTLKEDIKSELLNI